MKDKTILLIRKWFNSKTGIDLMHDPSLISLVNEIEALRIHDVSGSLLSDEEIREAADEGVFDKNGMRWSNNDSTAGDNYGSFMAGVKWALSRLCNDR